VARAAPTTAERHRGRKGRGPERPRPGWAREREGRGEERDPARRAEGTDETPRTGRAKASPRWKPRAGKKTQSFGLFYDKEGCIRLHPDIKPCIRLHGDTKGNGRDAGS